MDVPSVYVDFNGIEYLGSDRAQAVLDLNGYGTLASLARQRVRVAEGMALMLFEPNDLEVAGVAHFDPSRTDPAGRVGAWVARINAQNISASTRSEEPREEHLCFGCGQNLYAHLAAVGRKYKEVCPHCGTSIMEPLAPPAPQPNNSFKLDGPDGPPT